MQSESKWESRRNPNLLYTQSKPQKVKTPLLPSNLIKYNNLLFTECKICKNGGPNSPGHFKQMHNVPLMKTSELIDLLEGNFPRGPKYSRNQAMILRESFVNEHLSLLKKFLA